MNNRNKIEGIQRNDANRHVERTKSLYTAATQQKLDELSSKRSAKSKKNNVRHHTMSGAAQDFNHSADKVMSHIKKDDFYTKFVDQLKLLASKIKEMINMIGDKFNSLGDKIVNSVQDEPEFGTLYKDVKEEVGKVNKKMKKATRQIKRDIRREIPDAVFEGIESVGDLLQEVSTAAGKVVADGKKVVPKEYRDGLKDLKKDFNDGVRDAGISVEREMRDIKEIVGDMIKGSSNERGR